MRSGCVAFSCKQGIEINSHGPAAFTNAGFADDRGFQLPSAGASLGAQQDVRVLGTDCPGKRTLRFLRDRLLSRHDGDMLEEAILRIPRIGRSSTTRRMQVAIKPLG